MNERKIYIKAHFEDWLEVDFSRALRFLGFIARPWDFEVFKHHFRGVTYEELATANQRND